VETRTGVGGDNAKSRRRGGAEAGKTAQRGDRKDQRVSEDRVELGRGTKARWKVGSEIITTDGNFKELALPEESVIISL
jgi:hypothetical protein